MQSIDSLRELNSKLLAEIAELRKGNDEIPELREKLLKFAEVEAENAKLRQIIEENAKRDAENAEHKIRIEELEKNSADISAENAELKAELAELRHDFNSSNLTRPQQPQATEPITSTLKFFTNLDDMCYGFSDLSVTLAVILCASHIIGYILCLLMFLSCIIRMVIKYRDNSHQNDDEYEYAPLLRDDVDAKLIDDEEINEKCIEAYKKEAEVYVKLIDI
ncbi:hypothetical protein C1646_817254 [Rhizophagus diaphanus]|nr:hypothetical protein C1646_817254 [Rhizophagus diaphanus] [Rhizophagus sp. MUCL 43196]